MPRRQRTPAIRCGGGEAIYFSISTRPSPNAASASRIAPLEHSVELDMRVDAAADAAPAPAAIALMRTGWPPISPERLFAQEFPGSGCRRDSRAQPWLAAGLPLHRRLGRAFKPIIAHCRGRATRQRRRRLQPRTLRQNRRSRTGIRTPDAGGQRRLSSLAPIMPFWSR